MISSLPFGHLPAMLTSWELTMAKAKKQEIQHDPVVSRFGERLRLKRLERGFTQAQLAEAAGTSSP